MHVELGGDLSVEGLQELLELDRAVAGVQGADHLAGGEIERRVQARGAGALVVVGRALRGRRAASARSARCGPAPGSGSSHPRTAPPPAPADSGTGRRHRGPSPRTAGPWRASRSPGGGVGARTPSRSDAPPTASAPPRVANDRVDQCVASLGVLSNVLTITSSTCASVILRGWPGRGSSIKPSRRCSANRLRHLVTIGRYTPNRPAICVLFNPSAASNTIRERCASACALLRRRAHDSNCERSSSLNSIRTAVEIGIHVAYPTATELMHHDTRSARPALRGPRCRRRRVPTHLSGRPWRSPRHILTARSPLRYERLRHTS